MMLDTSIIMNVPDGHLTMNNQGKFYIQREDNIELISTEKARRLLEAQYKFDEMIIKMNNKR